MPALIRQSALLLVCISLAFPLGAATGYIVDGDGDAVSDEIDDCPYTRPGTQVDAKGCPLKRDDADVDGIPDDDDACPFSAPGAKVDAQGCALDADFDGVADGIDRCPGTGFALPVNASGCANRQVAVAQTAPSASKKVEQSLAPQRPSPSAATAATPMSAPIIASPPVAAAAPAPASSPAPSAPAINAEAPVLMIHFNVNSLRLGAGDASAIVSYARLFAQRLAVAPGARLHLRAYADHRENDWPTTLAVGRMTAVRNALMAQGIPSGLIQVEHAVLASGDAGDNRRAEVRLVK